MNDQDDDGQLFLFAGFNDVALPKMRPRPPDVAAKYSKARPKRRTLCDDCVRDIHERGVGVAPYPRTVSWKRVDFVTGAVDLLCGLHYRLRRGES